MVIAGPIHITSTAAFPWCAPITPKRNLLRFDIMRFPIGEQIESILLQRGADQDRADVAFCGTATTTAAAAAESITLVICHGHHFQAGRTHRGTCAHSGRTGVEVAQMPVGKEEQLEEAQVLRATDAAHDPVGHNVHDLDPQEGGVGEEVAGPIEYYGE